MPVPQALVTRYFQLVVARQFTESEREMERIKHKMTKTEWNRGYFRALYGMYLANKNTNDSYVFFSKIDITDKPTLHAYRREFLEETRNGLHADFDRGYFSAWADCMRVLARIEVPEPPAAKSKAVAEEKNLETLRSDKSQATIANFLKSKNGNGEKKPQA
jgi:hypothetical protein